MDSGSEWDVRSLPSDFSLSLPSSPGHGPIDSHGMPGTPLSLHSVPDSAFSLSPHSASHVFLPPPMEDRDRDRNGALETSRTLVLPSLPWPHMSSPWGETVGEMKLLVVSRASANEARAAVCRALLEENSDVLRVYAPETLPDGTKTTWAETLMRNGESDDGGKNICIAEAVGYDEHGDDNHALRGILSTVYEPFRRVQSLLNPTAGPTPQLIDLLASPGSHLYLACIVVLPNDPTPMEHILFRVLEATMPIVSLDTGSTSCRARTSSGSPSRRQLHSTHTLPELAHSLFRSPQHRDKLRREAAAGFLSWWSAERESVLGDSVAAGADSGPSKGREAPPSDASFPFAFRALAMPVLDPLHHSMFFSPLTLLPPLFHHMTRFALRRAARARWGCSHHTEHAFSTPLAVQTEKKFSIPEPPCSSVEHESDWGGSHWTWGGIVRGVAGFAAMTAIWAGLVWATTV